MKINNLTKKTILAQEARLADKLWARMKGLLGEQKLLPGQGLVLKPCNSIHTFFMNFSIDVLFLDKADRVVKMFSVLKPFRLTSVYFSAHLAIELPAGVIQATGTSLGDIVQLED
jgi:uncharacterized protein